MHSIPAKQTDFSKDCTTVSSISYSKIKKDYDTKTKRFQYKCVMQKTQNPIIMKN